MDVGMAYADSYFFKGGAPAQYWVVKSLSLERKMSFNSFRNFVQVVTRVHYVLHEYNWFLKAFGMTLRIISVTGKRPSCVYGSFQDIV